MSSWMLEPVSGSPSLAMWIVVGLAALIFVRPTFGSLSRPRHFLLAGLRALAILVVALLLLRPTCVFSSSQPRLATLLVLFDQSRSMQLPDRTGQASRWSAQRTALNEVVKSLPQLGKSAETKLYSYDSTLHESDISKWPQSLPADPPGEHTDIGTVLEEALRRETGKRIAGVMLLGDGTQTTLQPVVDSSAAARRVADEFGAPLFTTVFGPAGDSTQAKDIALERLDEQYSVFVKNEIVIRGRLRISGYVNQPIPLSLKLFDAAGKLVETLEQRKVARLDGESIPFEFPYTPTQAGHYKLTVAAAEQPGELVTKNNALSAYLTVLEGGLRVLLIDAGKRLEFRFLRRALQASPDIELDDFVVDSLGRSAWPVNLAPILSSQTYDVYILANVPAAALGDDNQKLLATAVEKGKGLLALGGTRAFGAGNYAGTPLADVLPVSFDRFERQDFESPDRIDLFIPGPLALTPAGAHSITRLAEGPENERAWQQLPPLDFANRFSSLKNSPGVRTLLAGPKEEPLLVTGEYGNGRVLAFAGESTWRWVLEGHASQHRRFWRQAILWLARRDESQQSDVWIKLAQRRFQPGANVAFQTGARSPEGEILDDARFSLTLTLPDGRTQPVRTTPGKENATGNFTVKEPGDYVLEVTASRQGETLGRSRAEFFVYDEDAELGRPAADHEHFARLSQLTKEFGGRPVSPEDVPKLLAELAARPPDLEQHESRWRFGDDPLSAWLCLLTLVIVLGTEWWLRKKWGMV